MRISDWSSDVCSSDLNSRHPLSARVSRVEHPCGDQVQRQCYQCGADRQFAQHGRVCNRDWRMASGAKRSVWPLPCRLKRGDGMMGMVYKWKPQGAPDSRHLPRMVQESDRQIRSEEHTSEIQSLMRISYDVFCLQKQKSLSVKMSSTK